MPTLSWVVRPWACPGSSYMGGVAWSLQNKKRQKPASLTTDSALEINTPQPEAAPPAPKKELLKGLIFKKLPTYTLTPEISVEDGILASSENENMFKRRLRRLSFNIQAVLRGEQASKQAIIFKDKHALTINMKTAREIGVYPNFKLLRNTKLLNKSKQIL